MPTTCDIEIHSGGSDIVYAGQELCGTVRLTLTEEKHLRGVYIQIHGEGICSFKVFDNEYRDQFDYINEVIYFIGAKNGTYASSFCMPIENCG